MCAIEDLAGLNLKQDLRLNENAPHEEGLNKMLPTKKAYPVEN